MKRISLYFLKLGFTGFGGPVALVSRMHEDLVRKLGWISEEDFQKSLSLSSLSPGPLASQLAMKLGWYEARALGAFLAGFCFIAPGLLIVLIFSYFYVQYQGFPWLHALFYGASSGVIPIIFLSAVKLSKNVLKRDYFLWFCAFAAGIVSFIGQYDLIWILLTIGLLAVVKGMKFSGSPRSILLEIFWFFFKAGALVYGTGFSIIPYLRPGLVERLQWVNDQQFMDAIAVAMLTPGPVLITVAFLGFLIAGFGGALAAAVGVFLPAYGFTIVSSPLFDRFSHSVGLRNFVSGVTAGAIGAIFGVVASLSIRTLNEPGKWGIAALALILVSIKKYRLPDPLVLLICAGLGYLLSLY